MSTNVIFLNQKQALLDLCSRNALRYARGEGKLTMDLQNQLQFLYENSTLETKELLDKLFEIRGDIEEAKRRGLLD